jgi:hypothetical protein
MCVQHLAAATSACATVTVPPSQQPRRHITQKASAQHVKTAAHSRTLRNTLLACCLVVCRPLGLVCLLCSSYNSCCLGLVQLVHVREGASNVCHVGLVCGRKLAVSSSNVAAELVVARDCCCCCCCRCWSGDGWRNRCRGSGGWGGSWHRCGGNCGGWAATHFDGCAGGGDADCGAG